MVVQNSVSAVTKADKNNKINEVRAHVPPMHSISYEKYSMCNTKRHGLTIVALPVEEMSSCWRSEASPSVTAPLNKVEISAPHFSVGLACHLYPYR